LAVLDGRVIVLVDKGMLLCGNLVVDLVKSIGHYPSESNLCVISEIFVSIGGLANNNSVNLRVLDPTLKVGVLGKVGEDEYGQFILDRLAEYEVDVQGVSKDPKVRTSFTDVFTVDATGVRTFFHHYGANAVWGPKDIDWDMVSNEYDWVQLGYLMLLNAMDAPEPEFGTQAAKVLAEFKRRGFETAIDLVSEESERFKSVVVPALKYVDHFVVNEFEAEQVTGIEIRKGGFFMVEQARAAARALFNMGVGKNVVIHAPEGSVGLSADGIEVIQPSHKIDICQIKSSVGAGDAFCSGVLYGLKKGCGLYRAIQLGTAMGAMNLFDMTATGGAVPLAKVLEFMENVPYRQLQEK
jgi:sugar/nucleoside kinase (ribokinase family)